jgi:threonine-phosphate decarboxylase
MIPPATFLCAPPPQGGLKPEKILDFSIPVNPLGPSKRVERRLKTHLPAALGDPDPRGGNLIKALAQYHGLSEEEILPGAGATALIHSIPRAFSVRRVLMVPPLAAEYERALETAARGPKPQIDYLEAREEDGFEVDVNGLISSLTLGYDALFLSNPGFPTGNLISKEDLVRVLAQTERHHAWFVLDETSLDFLEEQSLKERIPSCSRLVILRSFSNFFALPGLRVGYLLGSREAVQEIRKIHPPRTVNALGQIAAAESLQDQTHIRRTKDWMPGERERLAQGLRSIPGFVPYPGGANFLLVQLLPFLGIDGKALREGLLHGGFRIGDCGPYRPLGPDFIFLAVRTRRENNLLLKALSRLVANLPNFRVASPSG